MFVVDMTAMQYGSKVGRGLYEEPYVIGTMPEWEVKMKNWCNKFETFPKNDFNPDKTIFSEEPPLEAKVDELDSERWAEKAREKGRIKPRFLFVCTVVLEKISCKETI